MDTTTPIIELKGIGEKTQKLFQKIGIVTVSDLIHYLPKGYDKYEEPVAVADACEGKLCSVMGRVLNVSPIHNSRNLDLLKVEFGDADASMQLVFFHMSFLKKVLQRGNAYIVRGVVQKRGLIKQMEQPRYFKPEEYNGLKNVLLPQYSLTKGLTNQAITKAVKQALENYPFSEEYYPDCIRESCNLMPYKAAITNLHFPRTTEQAIAARKRIAFDEFFSFLYGVNQNKASLSKLENNYQMFETADTVRFLEKLPFRLTKGQLSVWGEIKDDLGSAYCMNRLIQGDVGSGKTIIAVLALLMCVANGYQGAFMAPTEVLATQHYETILGYIKAFQLPFSPVLLTGSVKGKERKEIYRKIQDGSANLIIGTHALIQESVEYHELALVVTDEQHRFGVKQREALANKAKAPHVLVMSATPIPRTLAIILYGDLKISVIKELPSERLPIKNCVVNTSFRPKAYQFIAKEVNEGRQAYVICPQVYPGEMDGLENVVEYAEKLRAFLPETILVSCLHGKMKPAEKNKIMEDFTNGNIDVLVSTTVIEVGINCPNATVMMVENAERFGLAQLHQLRGRVGRGSFQSYCIFMSTGENSETMQRLELLNQSNDGFFIAQKDMELRGPGDIFGSRQSGDFAFQYADIYADAEVLKMASDALDFLLAQDPELKLSENQKLKNHFENDITPMVDFRTI